MNRASSRAPRAPASIALRTLGAIDAAGGDGVPLDGLLVRPKPLALLVYLVMGGAGRSPRRDSLVATFWPDSDAERARSSLRQAVYQLRRTVGAGVVTGRGEEVTVHEGGVTCDAVDFERRAASGDLAGALELYHGDFLPGFHIEGAPAFERWAEERRGQLRGLAASAARALRDAAAEAGDDAGAMAWSRRVLSIAPDDEPSLRRLVALLERAGDRTAAIGVYDAFVRRLREQYGLEPAAETVSAVSALRGGATSASGAPPLDVRRVLVTVFRNETGDAALEPFGRLMADAIAEGLLQLEGVRVVPFTGALATARHVDAVAAHAPATEWTRLAAEETGAGTVVSGAYYAAGSEVVAQGWIRNARTGEVLRALGPARAPVAAPLPAVEALRDEARTHLARELEARVLHVRAAGRARSYEAHSAYVEGMARFVSADWRGALEHLGRATTSDAAYALPLLVSAIAHWNLGELERAEGVVARAQPLVVAAGPFERALLDMVRAWLAGDWGAAYEAVRRQAAMAPGSIASFQVAEEARRRNRPREALQLLAAIDPSRGEMRGWVFYWVVMAQALHMLGEHARELEVARRARALHPEAPIALRLELHARAALGDEAGVLACVEDRLAMPSREEPSPGTLMREAAHELLAHGSGRAVAETLLRESLAWFEELPGEAGEQPAVARAIARARYEVGDWAGARLAFKRLAGDRVRVADCGAIHHPHLQGHLDHGYLGVIAIRRGDEDEAARIDARLERERGPHLFGSAQYWRAAMAALRGDADAAVRLLRRAFATGLPYEPFIHADPHFRSVRGVRAFEALLAPRG